MNKGHVFVSLLELRSKKKNQNKIKEDNKFNKESLSDEQYFEEKSGNLSQSVMKLIKKKLN